ncbi:F1F0 ATP synthase subunit 4 [Pneumocystis jirovecii RU7]|uniref:ATP synthase subunit 4 n=1 Tax=Pneumocystis jirovecii (strain RU7) TaxID=1408657 RepID=A0A0W4ZWK1_PNEJ7|nr:F1F0 ATP synthase subunit 4 [Pneumocystis jirovecii RU7]KTW32746.1 hypothetical protein T551_00231 [Pneumocystis jirovecii RU7]
MLFSIAKRNIEGRLGKLKTVFSSNIYGSKYLATQSTQNIASIRNVFKQNEQTRRSFSSKIDPKLKAAALIDLLPKSSILSKTGMITMGTMLSIAAISNELYVVNEETVILASFIGIIWFLINSGKKNYINWMDNHINRMHSLLSNSRQEHASAVKERIETIEALKDVVDVTKNLFEMSKETLHLEAKEFELSQIVNAQQQAKAVLNSWVRYESALRQREQAYLAETIISKVKKELQQPKIQQQILNQSITEIEGC